MAPVYFLNMSTADPTGRNAVMLVRLVKDRKTTRAETGTTPLPVKWRCSQTHPFQHRQPNL